MFFKDDEVIELKNKKEYFVLNTTMLDDDVFYQIQEVKDDNVIGNKIIIMAVNKKGNLTIDEVVDKKLLTTLNAIWAS